MLARHVAPILSFSARSFHCCAATVALAWRLLLWPALFVVISGCGGSNEDEARSPQVFSVMPIWKGDGWTLSAEPVLAIGSEGDSKYEFSRIVSALVLPGGRIVVANFTTPPEVRIYSAEGEHVVSMGRAGNAPGEFKAISWIDFRPPDTVRVYDSWARRITFFDTSGRLLRTRTVEAIAGKTPQEFVLKPGFGDGSLLAVSNLLTPRIATPQRARTTTPLIRVDETGTELKTIARVPDAEFWIRKPGDLGTVMFGLRSAITPSRQFVYVGTAEQYAIEVYDTAGRIVRRFARAYERPVVQRRDIAAIERSTTRSEHQRPNDRRLLSEVAYAERLPAHDRHLLLDPIGHVWVKDYVSPADTVISWSVFDQQGRLLGPVRVSRRFRVTEIGGDYVLGVWQDDLGIETVRMYRITRD